MADKVISIYEAVNNARLAFLAENPKKTGKNKFSNFSYYELSDILPIALNIMKAYNLCPTISFTAENFCEMTIYHIDSGSSLKLTSPFTIAEIKGANGLQNLGSAHTYMRRYMWLLFLEITEADFVNENVGKPNIQHGVKNNISEAIAKIKSSSSLDELKRNWLEINSLFKGADLEELTKHKDNAKLALGGN
jgi:hypothetical protein